MAGGPCTRLQSRLSVFLETTSVAVGEFRPLVLAFAAALQAQMASCGALPCPDTPHILPADDLIGINSGILAIDESLTVEVFGRDPALHRLPIKPLGYHWQNLHRDFAPKPAGLTPRMAALVAAQGRPAV